MTTLKTWSRRPPELANLYNPAFCSALLNRAALGYSASKHSGLPFFLAFVALTVLLHPQSTEALPTTSRTNFHGWLLDNPQVLIGFSDRSIAIAPFAREAISFGLIHRILVLNESCLHPLDEKRIKRWEKEQYNARFSRDAQLLGKLLGQVKDQATIFTLFGIRP